MPSSPRPGSDPLYDEIGAGYADTRRPDPRIGAQIDAALGAATRVVNVGAGAGSYEPAGRVLAAVDPSPVMLRQRGAGAAAAVRGVAEALPFPARSFDAAMAVLTLHHWGSWRDGIREMLRVAPRVTTLTFDTRLSGSFWLARDYLPEMIGQDEFRFPLPETIAAALPEGAVEVVPVPWDCTDGFAGAFWRRPERYLDPAVRVGMSAVAVMDQDLVDRRMARLGADLASGAWDERNGALRALDAIDLGYRLVSGGPRA